MRNAHGRSAPRPAASTRASGILSAAVLCGGVGIVFWPLLGASFLLDDFVRLYDLANYGLVKLLISPHGGHLLVASNGVYALFSSLFGLVPLRWFAAVLTLHVVNTLLLLGLLRRLGCSRLAAVAMAALWALCPVHVGTLGWMAVFGHLLLGSIVLILLRDMVTVANRGTRIRGSRAALWWLLALLAATSFGSGLGLAMVLGLAAALLLDAGPGRRLAVWTLGSLVLVVPALYAIQHALYFRLYDVAPFMTPVTAIRLEPRVLLGQLVQAAWFVLDALLCGAGMLLLGSLGGDHFVWVSMAAALLAALATWALWRASHRLRSRALGIAVLAVATYATLAVGGVLAGRLEVLRSVGFSTSAAIATQAMVTRYHYVPTLLLTILLALAAQAAAARGPGSRRATNAVLLAVLTWLGVRAPWDRAWVQGRATPIPGYVEAIGRLEAAIERSPLPDPVYLPNEAVGGGVVAMHSDAFPGWAGLWVIYHPDGVVRGRTVRFIERDPALLATLQAQTSTPIARLVVAPNPLSGSGS